MKTIIIAAAGLATLALAGGAMANDIEREAQIYGATESEACEKTKRHAQSQLGSAQLLSFDPCTCGIASFTKPGAKNRYWCRTVAHGRYPDRERKPMGHSSPR